MDDFIEGVLFGWIFLGLQLMVISGSSGGYLTSKFIFVFLLIMFSAVIIGKFVIKLIWLIYETHEPWKKQKEEGFGLLQ